MSKDKRNGGKYAGNHTTFTALAAQVSDIVHKIPGVTKILAGRISPGLKATASRHVKVTDEVGCILLQVRDTRTLQQVRLYVSNIEQDRITIAQKLKKEGIEVHAHKKDQAL